jgi:muconolactone delta-isomerase
MSESPKSSGVVRGTLQYATGVVFGLYSRAEQYPVVKTTFDMYKPFVAPVVTRVVAAADPWVESVDTVVTGAWQTVNTRVVEPARKRNSKGQVSISGVYAEVREVATVELKNRYTALLDLSDQTVDYLLPESFEVAEKKQVEKEEKPKSLVEVSSKAQKRAFKRLEGQWQDVRAFSSGRLREIVHVDLVAYAENGYEMTVSFTNDRVLPVVNQVSARGLAVVASVQSISAEKSKLLWEAIARYREYSIQQFNEAYNYTATKAEAFGVPVLVGKAKEVSLGEVSEFVLVKLNFKEQNDQFVVVERKLFDLFRTLVGLIVTRDLKPVQASASTQAAPVAQAAN